ncbi:hypothetical protein MLE08_003666 [Klebsiella aerogenes]|nr:hypothetical protein [Klebsiella aerogenes]
MNNEIEQIAWQNDMSVEFVTWFFDEKKSGCGNVWFIMMAAMWEGWKAREGEVTAMALTLEKSREASGCPAGVDLQDWVKQMAAENVALRAACGGDGSYRNCPACTFSEYIEAPETPATDRIVAESEARGVEKGIAHLENKFSNIGVQIMNLQWLADSLREGADK